METFFQKPREEWTELEKRAFEEVQNICNRHDGDAEARYGAWEAMVWLSSQLRNETLLKEFVPYLEKQKEQNSNIELIQRSWYMEGYHDREFGQEPKWIMKTGKGGPKYELNPKYGQPLAKEQKPVKWTELTWKDIVELEGIINNVHYDFSAGIGQESFGKEVLERFRNKKDDAEVDTCEQKPTWSEEDEKIIDTIISVLGQYINYKTVSGSSSGYATPMYIKEIDWLKSLLLGGVYSSYDMAKAYVEGQYNILKNLDKYRPSWKPSEEQMEALGTVVKGAGENSVGSIAYNLKELYEQLKKL